jgi:hypothetical protein
MELLPWIVINLGHRNDRMELLHKSFANQSIERFEAIRHTDPEIGCRESHLAAVRLAKERGYPWVLVLEDDCEPYPEFPTLFRDVLLHLWKHKDAWELYNGGPNPGSVRRCAPAGEAGGSTMLDIDNWISAQFIIINSTVFDKILEYDELKHPKKIDEYYSTCFKTISSTPMLTRQLDTYSDLAKSVTNNIPLFERSRKMMQMFTNA